ncbi:uncharacterized protein LOC108599110 [Drosophila busckii]|nr:uncharacterized protein LOC108599110 [Drosophila busckii]
MFTINIQEEPPTCTESQLDILLKIHEGQYKLVKKNKRSTVWNVYREIARRDGTKLKWRYYCLGCKRVMQSTGGTTSNLRIHKCHVRYLKQHGKDADDSLASPDAEQTRSGRVHHMPTFMKRERLKFDEESDGGQEDMDGVYIDVKQPAITEHVDEPKERIERPLLKLFSEEESWSPEIIEEDHSTELEQEMPIITEDLPEEYGKETIRPNSSHTMHIDASAISEAECYARAWAQAFLKLSEDQKFYAKRSIDELLVLGRLERLNISTVTSLTTNL